MAWIYVIKNNINDKLYVGKTEVGIEKRFKEHVRNAKNGSEYAIHRAMRKHGVEHFWPELIEETDNPNEREVYWIKKLGTYEYGYNETRGGEGIPLYDRDYIIETYKRLGTKAGVAKELEIDIRTVAKCVTSFSVYARATPKVRMCDMNLVEIKIFSNLTEAAEYILKEGKAKSNLSGIRNAIGNVCRGHIKNIYGYIFEYVGDWKKNVSTVKKKFHAIIQTDLNDNFIAMYNSCSEAAKAVNGKCERIRECCVGSKKSYRNFKWKFGMEIQYSPNCRPILQIEKLTGKIIKKWNSITEAANVLGISKGCINQVCNGKRKSAGGFMWRYADEIEKAA